MEYQLPEKRQLDDKLDDYEYAHPAFGAIRLSRSQGHHNLFGSAITHQHAINLEISYATMRRGNSHDWLLPGKTILNITFSEAQFAQFVTSAGSMPTPVTIRYVNGKYQPLIARDEEMKSTYTKEMRLSCKKAVKDLRSAMKALDEMASSSAPLSKKAVREILAKLQGAARSLEGDLPHIQTQFVEAMEEVTEVSKSEIQAHLNASIQQMGLEMLEEAKERLKVSGRDASSKRLRGERRS